MAKFKVSVTETYVQCVVVEAPDAHEAEQIVRGLYDQGLVQPSGTQDTYDGYEVWCEGEATPEEAETYGRDAEEVRDGKSDQ